MIPVPYTVTESTAMLNSAYNAGARLHTNSWGAGSEFSVHTRPNRRRDDRTSTWDQYWNYDGMTVLFAAGNERNDGVSPPGTAKNVITVGGHKNRYSGSPDEITIGVVEDLLMMVALSRM